MPTPRGKNSVSCWNLYSSTRGFGESSTLCGSLFYDTLLSTVVIGTVLSAKTFSRVGNDWPSALLKSILSRVTPSSEAK